MVHENVKFIFQRIFVIWQMFLFIGRRRVVALSYREMTRSLTTFHQDVGGLRDGFLLEGSVVRYRI